MYKSFKDISLPITEEEYRNDGCFHYSTLATFEREGIHCIPRLKDKKESPSLLFGSCVDCLVTDGEEAYNNNYIVADLPPLSDNITKIVKGLADIYKTQYLNIKNIPKEAVIAAFNSLGIGLGWKEQTKLDKVYAGEYYYRLLALAGEKTIISSELNEQVYACYKSLKESPATKQLFAKDSPFEPEIERCYQLKFKHIFDDLVFSCMCDLIYVDHKNKNVILCDLKTSSHYEDEFYLSFIQWSYFIQARSYWRIVRATMDEDEYFKDFNLTNMHFIVVNKNSLTPLVWEFEDTKKYGTLVYGKQKNIICRDPLEIAKDLNYYLNNNILIHRGININKPNKITDWLNKEC